MKKFIIGNWKMYPLNFNEASYLTNDLVNSEKPSNAEVVICPAFPFLKPVADLIQDSGIALGAQDCALHEKGPYTGEVSSHMLVEAGCKYVILGHSERRNLLAETAEIIKSKITNAHASGLTAIVCVGEPEPIHKQGGSFEYIQKQLQDCLPSGIETDKLLIAYEPVWAIGSGTTPAADEISIFSKRFKSETGLPLLYGGSVKSDFAAALSNLTTLDGLLVGAASLNAPEFLSIISYYCRGSNDKVSE